MINIYLITNHAVSPKKVYVGRTKKSLEERFSEHVKMASRENNKILHEAILEYGKRNFTIELLESVSEELAAGIEERYIRNLNSHYIDGGGYNMRYETAMNEKHYNGADVETIKNNLSNGDVWNKGVRLSEETKLKVSKTKKRRFELGLYEKYGHKHSEETKRKLSEIAKNRPPPSDDTRIKLKEKSSERKCYYNPTEKKRVFLKNDQTIPEGYIKGKGTVWVNDGKTEYSIDLWEREEYTNRGYSQGRLVYVGKNS